jgi:hypothetical protein
MRKTEFATEPAHRSNVPVVVRKLIEDDEVLETAPSSLVEATSFGDFDTEGFLADALAEVRKALEEFPDEYTQEDVQFLEFTMRDAVAAVAEYDRLLEQERRRRNQP